MPQNYNPKARAFVAKSFLFAGRRFEIGEEFPHLDLRKDPKAGFGDNELRGLWLADLVEFPDDPAQAAADRAVIEAEKARIKALEDADDELIDATMDERAAALRAELGLASPEAELAAPVSAPVTAQETPKTKTKAKHAGA